MSSKPASERRAPRLLWIAGLLVLLAAGAMWAASALRWLEQRFRTPFSGETTGGLSGAELRPELVPVALAALAAVAALLATGGLLRRLVGLLVAVAGAVVLWRSVLWDFVGWFGSFEGVPSGSTPIGGMTTNPAGPLLMAAAGVALTAAGVLTLLMAHRMPAMGAKYSAPSEAKRQGGDPDRRLWDALDADEDPTDRDRES